MREHKVKVSINFFDLENIPIFSSFLFSKNNNKGKSNIEILDIGQKVNNIINTRNLTSSKKTFKNNQKVITKNEIAEILKEIAKSKNLCLGQAIKLIKKAEEKNPIV